MRRLIERGLMFGNLIRVDSPAWVTRYNRALAIVADRQTALTEFHIDMAGFSPEIGDELGEIDYLSPEQGHRQFILLTTEQKSAPLINADLSVSRDVLRRFIVENESQLFSLTARDAVLGQIEDEVWQIARPADLLQITRLRVAADTTGNHVAEADRLTALIERFRTEPDAWHDDVLIARMIEQARQTGDVVRNPVQLGEASYDIPDFWTSRFGGVYLFRSPRGKAAIFADPTQREDLPGIEVMTIAETDRIAMWMARHALAEPIVSASGANAAAILRQKIDFILVDAAVRLGLRTGEGTRAELRRAAGRMGAKLPPEIEGLSALLRYAERGGDWPVIDSANPAYFYAIRASQGPARGLVNRLLTELAPHDLRAMFILNKPLFYRRYQQWDEAKREYVADHLAREYQIDKQGTREALFGPEPGMAEEDPGADGPWGRAPVRDTARPAVQLSENRHGPWGARR